MLNKTSDQLHFHYTNNANLVGKYHFAQLENSFHELPPEIKCFSERSSIRDAASCGVHCFISDIQFECLWSNCDRYLNKLQQLALFIGPDFSLYRDMEKWHRIYNCGRNYAISFYLAQNGVNIIPVATWAFLSDLDWSLDGFQEGCTLAVTNNGCLRDPSSRKIFISGVEIIQNRLKPKRLYVCGKEMPELKKYTNIKYFPNFSESHFKKEK